MIHRETHRILNIKHFLSWPFTTLSFMIHYWRLCNVCFLSTASKDTLTFSPGALRTPPHYYSPQVVLCPCCYLVCCVIWCWKETLFYWLPPHPPLLLLLFTLFQQTITVSFQPPSSLLLMLLWEAFLHGQSCKWLRSCARDGSVLSQVQTFSYSVWLV